jgi:DnaJ-class molecular chaperone
MANDLYSLLGITRKATQKQIREAFRKLARQYHPDVNPGNSDAEEHFKEISAAYEVLSDKDSRAKYDEHGNNWRNADQIEEMMRQRGTSNFHFGGIPNARTSSGSQSFEFDLADLDGNRGGFGGLFDGILRRTSGGPMRKRGSDIEHPVTVSLEEAYRGTKRLLELQVDHTVCTVCGGAGQVAGASCHNCQGIGQNGEARRIEVDIPPGVDDGTRIRVRGKGTPGRGGAVPGDLFLRVSVTKHPKFERHGDELHIEIDVPITEAALGGEVRVPTLKARTLALTIPAGTQSGRVFRLAGQGMPRNGGGFGDLHVHAQLRLPEQLNDAHRALFEQLRTIESDTNEPKPEHRDSTNES